ncbi:exopolygalacturonase-like [Musa acuminata AAA Group]|uniref:exopolygalacturonase-like n=1 Tax=Musa acuminata AAA Group TaxID=214697 RepID=UPI0031D6795A
MKLVLLYLCIICHGMATVDGARTNVSGGKPKSSGTFNVKEYGARGNGRSDDTKAFLAAWDAACKSSGQVKILIPSGTYFLNPIEFNGPCRDVQSLKFEMQGTLRATTDLRKYGNGKGWVEFRHVDGLTVTGGGTFDGQGAVSWPFNKCPKDKNCKVLPTSVKFVNTKDTVLRGITSLNSKFFHMALLGCHNFKGSGITISAPGTSPNTDGIHLEGSTGVTISSSRVATGDDCISIGQGNSLVTISGITCGPGHGISVGSLGRYNDEEDVKNVIVKDSTFQGTTNGVRIKTWANSPAITKVQNMTFDNLVMKNVDYPIVIDQTYCPFAKCDNSRASRVKLSDIHFKNIRGTTKRPEAVILRCSKGTPCQKLSLHNINLKNIGSGDTLSTCLNAKAEYSGKIFPPPCQ